MVKCSEGCTPTCEHCIYAEHETYEINGEFVLGEAIRCTKHPDQGIDSSYWCGDFHCFRAVSENMGVWVEVHGYCTAGGDPVWKCPNCGQTMHVYGIEHPDRKDRCEKCGQENIYPWEKKHDTRN